MDTRITDHIQTRLPAVFGIIALLALLSPALAADQPKPGPEHKKLEMRVGQWNYEGTSAASPFGPHR